MRAPSLIFMLAVTDDKQASVARTLCGTELHCYMQTTNIEIHISIINAS